MSLGRRHDRVHPLRRPPQVRLRVRVPQQVARRLRVHRLELHDRRRRVLRVVPVVAVVG